MKTAVALGHIHFEDIGTLSEVLADRGHELHYCDPACNEIDSDLVRDADLVIVLGGPLAPMMN
ncbi:hypothetical protein [Dyella sp.]|uniref:hypothetical protein n=1 Tax=Dyella sp. TaxID=1869338 RepID=UPI002F936541